MKTTPIAEVAEAAALSLISIHADCISQLNWSDDLFATDTNKTIYRAIKAVYDRTGETSGVATVAELQSQGKLERLGGRDAILELLKTIYLAPSDLTVDIADDYRHQLIRAKGYRDALKKIEEVEDDLRWMRADLTEVGEAIAKCGQDESTNIKDVKHHLMDLIDDLDRKTPLESFSTGLDGLDKHFSGGLYRGEMLVVGAPTGGGKSIMLYQAALAALEKGKSVAIFSLEMPAKAILQRISSNMIGKRVISIQDAKRESDQRNIASAVELRTAITKLMNAPLTICDSMSEVGEIDAEARRLAQQGKADVIIVDYLQIVTMTKADNREQAISELTRRLKLTALKTNSVVLTASQLNDEGKLRESRAIGMHADAVVIIQDGEECILKIIKNRRGQRDVFTTAKMRGEISRFEEVAHDPY